MMVLFDFMFCWFMCMTIYVLNTPSFLLKIPEAHQKAAIYIRVKVRGSVAPSQVYFFSFFRIPPFVFRAASALTHAGGGAFIIKQFVAGMPGGQVYENSQGDQCQSLHPIYGLYV